MHFALNHHANQARQNGSSPFFAATGNVLNSPLELI
jgi:hypothetical protein